MYFDGSGSFAFGSTWDEFDLMNIPVTQYVYGDILLNVPMGGGSCGQNCSYSMTLTSLGWGSVQVGTGLDFLMNWQPPTQLTPAPNNGTQPKQPISPVSKLICQQQAKAYQAKFDAANKPWAQGGAVTGGFAGVSIGVLTTLSTFQAIASAELINWHWNWAPSNTAYEIGYDQCISGQYQ
jgi:hypothetical protein